MEVVFQVSAGLIALLRIILLAKNLYINAINLRRRPKMNDTFNFALLKDELTRDEARKPKPYFDTAKPPRITIGIGRNLSDDGVSNGEIDLMFANDVQDTANDLDAHFPWWRALSQPRQRVMLNMCFNMGASKLQGFTHFLAAMRIGDWKTAGAEMKASEWWIEVGDRAVRLQSCVLTGAMPNER